MSKNLIPKIAKMLGVELGEEFKVEGDNRTQEEAKSALPKVAKELGVEYEL